MERAKNEEERCAYRSPTGRRCRNKVSVGWNMCSAHGDFGSAYAKAAEIVSNRYRLDTAEGVHAFLIRIARAAAAQEISTRLAGMLTYVAQTMLTSVKAVRDERQKLFLTSEEEAWQRKALADSYHDELHCEDAAEDEEDEEADDVHSGDESDRLAAAKSKKK